MEKSAFFYELPESLIAQHPADRRDGSRLLKAQLGSDTLLHSRFDRLPDFLNEGDCLILNDSKVLPCRLFGIKDTGARVEFLLLKRLSPDTWECIAGPGRRAKKASHFVFDEGRLSGEVLKVKDNGNRIVKFFFEGDFLELLNEIGTMPLPPYIKEKLEDKERYQTVYSRVLGSAAAPTAGLHFTKELLQRLRQKGVKTGCITLHVGLGTFRPVRETRIEDHRMHCELYKISEETADLIRETKKQGGRIIAVGTTSCRALEACASKFGEIRPAEETTDIFIYPGYEFKAADGLITNFHLPESTLLMLVCAFYGYERTMRAYRTAVEEKYRFFSFGDAMMIS